MTETTAAPKKRLTRKAPAETPATAPVKTATTGVRKAAVKPAVKRLAVIPDRSYFTSYIGREIVPGKSDFDVFDYSKKTKKNVLIEGPTGPGKTHSVMAYAAKEKMPFYSVSSNISIEASQLFGKYVPNGEGGFEWVDGPVTELVRHGGLLLLNEVNFIPDRTAAILFGLLDKRRSITLLDHKGEVIEAHNDLMIVADMNPDYEGTRPLNKAFRNRFAVQVFWDYDDKVESKLVTSNALRSMGQKFRTQQKDGAIETPCSTNMLMEFEDIIKELGWDFAKANFVNHFAGDERQAVGTVVDTFRSNLETDLLPTKRRQKTATADTDADPANDPWILDPTRDQKVVIAEDGTRQMVDAEWGIFGVEWDYKDDDDDDDE